METNRYMHGIFSLGLLNIGNYVTILRHLVFYIIEFFPKTMYMSIIEINLQP